MTKKIRSFMMVLALYSIVFNFANMMNTIDVAFGATCIEHGPWSYKCSFSERVSDASHTFTYAGFLKQCYAHSYSSGTTKVCNFCNYSTGSGTHSHGVSNHSCGATNRIYCDY